MSVSNVYIGALGRNVVVREETSDRQVLADTFTGLYHCPPYEIAPETVLDLGANIGLTAAHYAVLWPAAMIVAVEMDEESADLASVNAPNVVVLTEAVSSSGGIGTYNPDVRAEAFQFNPRGKEGKPVTSRTLWQIAFGAFPDGCVDFCKMDVEGAEWGIIASPSWAPLVCSLLVELHPVGDMPDDSDWLVTRAVDLLDSAGFDAERYARHPRSVWATRR